MYGFVHAGRFLCIFVFLCPFHQPITEGARLGRIGQELDVDENDIFRGHDRSFIVSKIVSGQVRVELANVFYQFSPKERMYILKHIKDGKIDCNRDDLYPRLTPSEAKFLTTPRGVN